MSEQDDALQVARAFGVPMSMVDGRPWVPTAEESPSPETGWFADTDVDADPRFPWQPCLDVGTGITVSLDAWFRTKVECEDFLRNEVIPNAGRMLDE